MRNRTCTNLDGMDERELAINLIRQIEEAESTGNDQRACELADQLAASRRPPIRIEAAR
jgi:hypothetical protein